MYMYISHRYVYLIVFQDCKSYRTKATEAFQWGYRFLKNDEISSVPSMRVQIPEKRWDIVSECRCTYLIDTYISSCSRIARATEREVGGWGRDPKKCTGRDWGMGSSTISWALRPVVKYHLRRGVGLIKFLENGTRPQPPTSLQNYRVAKRHRMSHRSKYLSAKELYN